MTRTLTRAQKLMLIGALAFLASGLVHVAVWLLAGLPALEGPVSWRKPIVFGLSTGVLSLSLAWVIGFLPQTTRLVGQTALYVALIAGELVLIAMQQWRGVGSHFNRASAFDGAVFTTMGVMIVIVSIIIGMWTIALFKPITADRDSAFAARAGMLLLNAGNVMGAGLAAWGSIQAAVGLPPNIFGEAGQMKVPHAVALHAIQVLPIIALMVRRYAQHTRLVRVATVGYTGVFVFTLVQTFSGRAPLDVTPASTLLLAASIGLMGWAVLRGAIAWRQARYAMLPEWDVAR